SAGAGSVFAKTAFAHSIPSITTSGVDLLRSRRAVWILIRTFWPQVSIGEAGLFLHQTLFFGVALELPCLRFRAISQSHLNYWPVLRLGHAQRAFRRRGQSVDWVLASAWPLFNLISGPLERLA